MANHMPTLELTISINEQTGWYLDRLTEKGLYGNGRAQASAIVLFDHCKLLIGQGKLDEAPLLPIKTTGIVKI